MDAHITCFAYSLRPTISVPILSATRLVRFPEGVYTLLIVLGHRHRISLHCCSTCPPSTFSYTALSLSAWSRYEGPMHTRTRYSLAWSLPFCSSEALPTQQTVSYRTIACIMSCPVYLLSVESLVTTDQTRRYSSLGMLNIKQVLYHQCHFPQPTLP